MESLTLDQQQLRQQHRRYISYNVGIWVLVLVVGALALVITRQYGNSLTARHQAGLDIQAGAELVANGNSFQAERIWAQAIDTWPGAVNTLITEHHKALAGMPLVWDAIEEIQASDPETLTGLSALKLRLLRDGQVAEPTALMQTFALDSRERRTAAFWLGRLALDQGDVKAAEDMFAIAWNGKKAERVASYNSTLEQYPESPTPRIAAMIRRGLWEEAQADMDALASVESPDAQTLALLGLLRELAGESDAARDAYTAALELLPNHRLAAQGLRRL